MDLYEFDKFIAKSFKPATDHHALKRTGVSILPLHYGHPPEFLYKRMVRLGGILSELILEKYGTRDYLERLADPFWFHSLSLAIGFDWNSSGTTTTTMYALKDYFSQKDADLKIVGGKGKVMSETGNELDSLEKMGFLSNRNAEFVRKKARTIARVDNNLLQDGYDLYLQFIAIDSHNEFSLIQQGICSESRNARRYHWTDTDADPIDDARNGIADLDILPRVRDLSTIRSRKHRSAILDLAKDKIDQDSFVMGKQKTLYSSGNEKILNLDIGVNWSKLREIYEYQPSDFHELFELKGVGKTTIRALSYLAEIVYGEEPSFKDPIKYSFALGGKDGIPKPVNYPDYDRCIEFYQEVLGSSVSGNHDLEIIARNLARASFILSSHGHDKKNYPK